MYYSEIMTHINQNNIMNTEKEVQNEFESRGDRLHRSFTS